MQARSSDKEIMDDLDCSGEVVNQTLRELDVINNWLGGNSVTLTAVNDLLKSMPNSSTIDIVDLGCGSGDMLKRISKLARRRNHPVILKGIDANPHIINYAKQNTGVNTGISFHCINIWSDEFKSLKFDIAVATLFLHHFSNEELIQLFIHLKNRCRIGIVVNDIHRHWLAFHSIKFLTTLFSKSSMVKYDAPLSVERAFTKSDLIDILLKANVTDYRLRWKWAFRWQLIIHTSLA